MSATYHTASGPQYLLRGWSLIWERDLRFFVLIPLAVNLLLFGGAFYWFYLQLEQLFSWFEGTIPDYLQWLSYLLWPLAIVTIAVVFSLIFTSFANLLAAPFNGLLAERVELKLTGKKLPDSGWSALVRDTPRMLGREVRKMTYYLPRAIGCLLLFLLPAFGQTLAPLIWFAFSAWMMAIQYCDYPFDNHKVDFDLMRRSLAEKRRLTWGFGASVTLCSGLPFINLLIMPVAICGATALWVDHYTQLRTGPVSR
ncbi:sulfate transporter CysZ [Oceanisphaera psychrotolerans]|uniref:Sulfate transporter CysZ n=1 Tax=Oceanisphaera psychrotolerans TaxID=1414654 RepID=A0A1J4QG76_9GAMM|nr:sulfate transporter CysZ [Oceanisphaera psychrotolerans]OIN10422.1 sulfate transporter CysZ [Oceanisphaera psychrotolerans]